MRFARVVAVFAIASLILATGCVSTIGPSVAGDALHSVVPDVAGQTRTAAEKTLTEAGYEIGTVTEQTGSAPGTVVSTKPVGGTAAPKGTVIDLVVAR